MVVKFAFTSSILEELSETKGQGSFAEGSRVIGTGVKGSLRSGRLLELELLSWRKLRERDALGEFRRWRGCRLGRVTTDETFPTFADDVGLAASD